MMPYTWRRRNSALSAGYADNIHNGKCRKTGLACNLHKRRRRLQNGRKCLSGTTGPEMRKNPQNWGRQSKVIGRSADKDWHTTKTTSLRSSRRNGGSPQGSGRANVRRRATKNIHGGMSCTSITIKWLPTLRTPLPAITATFRPRPSAFPAACA